MPRILVLEDEPLIAMMLRDWLAELGYETAGPASSVRSALDIIAVGNVDCAILDVSLDGEDCYPVADALLKRGVLIAFATGHGAKDVDARFKSALMLPKPFGFEAVEGIVRRLVTGEA
jgi:DNA-binding response OmpR family regulator